MRIFYHSTFLFFIIGLFFYGNPEKLHAQEVYFSISGQDVNVASGDDIGSYDFWIRPNSASSDQPSDLQMYDAGLGGFADIIDDEANTPTTYQLFRFSDLYELNDQTILPKDNTTQLSPLADTTAFTEQLFVNRWVPMISFADADEPSENGWVVRVKTGSGNDVNNFKMRFSEDESEKWNLISLNLSIGLYQTRQSQQIQYRPLWIKEMPDLISVSGEEESVTKLVDSFGTTIADSTDLKSHQPAERGLANEYGLIIKGARQTLNNLVVKGASSGIIPWIAEPVIVNQPELPEISFTTSNGSTCNELVMNVSGSNSKTRTSETRWLIEGKTYNGSMIQHLFADQGYVAISYAVPLRGRIVPGYVVKYDTVFVNQLPEIALNSFSKVISPSQNILLNAGSSVDPDGRDLEFRWFVNNVFEQENPQFRFRSTTSGTYSIRLEVDDTHPFAACTVSDTTFSVRVNSQPYAEIKHPAVFPTNTTTTFSADNTLDSDGDNTRFDWAFEENDAKSGRSVKVNYSEPGIYQATLITDDQTATQNATYQTTSQFKVNGAPVPGIAYDNSVAPGEIFKLSAAESSDPNQDNLLYSWELSDEQTSEAESWSTSFSEPGSFKALLTVNDQMDVANSIQKDSVMIRVNHPPKPVITAKDSTNGEPLVFSASKSNDEDNDDFLYAWDFGDGNTSSESSPSHQFGSSGKYVVTLTIDDQMELQNSSQKTTHNVVVNENPNADFSFPEVVAPEQTFVLDAGESSDDDGNIASYHWIINGEKAGEGEQFETSLTREGDHAVQLRVTDNSGFESAFAQKSAVIHVNHAPKPVFSIDYSVTEPGRETTFSATQSTDTDDKNLSYTWKFSDGSEYQGEEINRSFSATGTKEFTLTADDGRNLSNSTTTISGKVRVNSSPIIVTEEEILVNQRTITLDGSESYDADSDEINLTWILPDGERITANKLTWKAPEKGLHTIGLIADDGEGLDNSISQTRVTIRVNQPPVAVVDTLIQGCSGQTIIFSSARSFDPDGDTYSTKWDFGDGNTSSQNNPYHTYSKPGVYMATLTLTDGINPEPAVATIPVTINGSPTAKISMTDTTICVNTPLTFDGSQSVDPNSPKIGSHSWDFGDKSKGFGEKVTHLYSEPGTYQAVLTVIGAENERCGNVSQEAITITVVEGPRATFSVPAWTNPGDDITLNATDSFLPDDLDEAIWVITNMENNAPVDTVYGMETSIALNQPGDYQISLTVSIKGSTDCRTSTIEKFLTVNETPELTWNVPEKVAAGETFLLSAEGTKDGDGFISSYTWHLDNEKMFSGISGFLPQVEPGNYTIRLTVADNSKLSSGQSSIEQDIFVNPGPDAFFTLPDTTYPGDTIELSRETSGDSPLTTNISETWMVDDEPVTGGSFTADEPKHTVTLILNDKNELPNSVDTLVKTLHVIQSPNLTFDFPDVIVRDYSLTDSAYSFHPQVFFVDPAAQNNLTKEWLSNRTGDVEITTTWAPRGTPIESKTDSITVLPQLTITQNDNAVVEIPWNPSNPYVTLQAPSVNRDKPFGQQLSYNWTHTSTRQTQFGKNPTFEVVKGKNVIRLVIEEPTILGSKAVERVVTVQVGE